MNFLLETLRCDAELSVETVRKFRFLARSFSWWKMSPGRGGAGLGGVTVNRTAS